MKKITSKILAILLVLTLVGIQLITTGVYATDLLTENFNTSEENVKIDVTLGKENSNGAYTYSANLDSNDNRLYLKIGVLNTGYLKDIIISLQENNYIFDYANINDSRIKNISNDKIELNQINAGETVELAIPITIDKSSLISKDIFNKNSKVIAEATYVNDKNKEKKIKKEIEQQLIWNVDEEELTTETSQNVIRYLEYNNQTMISMILNDKLKDSKFPIDSKEIIINVPSLLGHKPSKIIVDAIQTANTNGDKSGVTFSNENWNYDQENSIMKINLTNNEDENGKINWDKELPDTFVVTYLYDVNMPEDSVTFSSKVMTNIQLINGSSVKNETVENEFVLDEKIGDIVTVDIVNNLENINKGYMYSNLDKDENKRETEFSQDYKINIGLTEAFNEIIIKEDGEFFGERDASDSIYDKKITISKEELVEILGENGSINVYKEDGSLIGTLNKDNLSLDINSSRVTFELSKPEATGEIILHIDKAIKSDLNFSKQEIKNFTSLTSKVKINQETSKEIKLEEPTSKANIEISNKNLSTIVKNENVIITATLETDDISDALYKNPEISIVLPEEVKNIDIKDATLLYEDELMQNEFYTDGNRIYLSLKGLQTKYATQSTSKGTVIRIVTDLTLDNLSPSKNENIEFSYTNKNELTSESNSIETPVNLVAPSEFVITNSMKGHYKDEELISQQGNEKIGNLELLTEEKNVTISGTIVNNLGKDAEGLKILGRIPFKGNKEINTGKDLGTTIDTTLSKAIIVNGIEATIYYSENGDATDNLEDESNRWTTNFSTNAKSYMIVANNNVPNTTKIDFNYEIIIPKDIDYDNMIKSSYGVYYNNNSEEGISQNVVLATPVGAKTGTKPELSVNIKAKDMFTGEELNENNPIKEGQYVTYEIAITNTSDTKITNTNASIELPKGMAKIEVSQPDYNNGIKEYEEKYIAINEQIGDLESNETKIITVNSKLVSALSEDGEEKSLSTTVTADQIEGEAKNVFKLPSKQGYVNTLLRATYEDQVLEKNKEVQYILTIENVNITNKTNVVAKMNLPEGLEYLSSGTANGEYEGIYDSKTREITFNIGELGPSEKKYIYVKANSIESNNEILETQVKTTCSETDETSYSNKVKIYYGKPKAQATLSSNISSSSLLDTDTLEYYIDVKNIGNVPTRVSIKDILPEGIISKSFKLDVNGGTIIDQGEYNGKEISKIVELQLDGTARLTITTKPVAIATGETKQITNTPEVYIIEQNSLAQVEKVDINSLTHTIEGTGGESSSGGNSTYKIMGSVWLDANKNGKKELEETKIKDIKMTLYDDKGYIAKDINGKEQIYTTDENGQYQFTNLVSGTYLVVAEYDTVNYTVTSYKTNDIAETENSDFFEAKLEDQNGIKNVAATDKINIGNSNMYNVDLGLKEREQFDLKLDKLVKKVTVTNTKLDPKTYEYNKNFAAVSLLNTYVEYTTVLIEYSINVTNEGKVPGYAKEIVDYLPEGMNFSSDLNNGWYLGKDGNIYTTALANTIINPGETKTINLVLSRKMTGENTGVVRNVAEISKDYNEYGLKDGDSTPGNNKDGEDDKASADVLLTMSTGKEIASFIGITLGVLSIIALAVYLIKKYIIKKI